MNREKVSDMLEECAELVRSGQMAERLYLDLCEQFGMRYRADNPRAFDSDDSDAADASRHHLEPQPPQQPAAPAPESRPAYRQQDRHVWSRREQAHQVYESRVAAAAAVAAAVAADMNRHDRLQRQQQRQQPQQRQRRQGYVPVHLRVSEEDRARQAEEAVEEAVAVHRQIRAEREAARLARRDQRLHPPELDHDHDQNNNNNSIVVLQDEIISRHEHNLGVARLVQSSLLDPEPDTVEQMEECD